ncbi:permease-like cell division protein FtsX [Corynebacterium frankenforstense]|uniref:permease-like cell division protein FtsX n=1 Tax=Corynebacterium frankenforstense TaxID=1230998 RepID=UPI0026F00026|nr:permease-like cell division protein FtsX [Corynebacterium frankenforstense]
MKFGYVLREAVKGLGRNVTMTVALIITTAISLALLATGFLVTGMTSDTKEIYLDRVEVMVQFDDEVSGQDTDCSSEACRAVFEKLEGADGVDEVTFRSREQSYQRFVEVFGESDPRLVEETSPDALPAALHVRLADPLDTTPLDPVRDMDHVAEVVDQVDDLRGATDNLDAVRNATFLLAAIQAVAAIFLIANMVQIAAYNRRDEMSIMRMVGASRWYTQAPFVLEAVFATIIGAALATGGLLLGKGLVIDKALRGLYEAQLIAPVTTADIWLVMPVVAVVGILFAALTAQVTLRAYVRK